MTSKTLSNTTGSKLMAGASRSVFTILLLVVVCGSVFGGTVDYNVGAYYYPWYNNGNFHDGPSKCLRWHLVPQQMPTLGWYDDSNVSVISQHFLWARSTGIDFFVCSYWGQGKNTDVTIRNNLFTNPDIGNLKLCVFLETDYGTGITLSNIASETDYLCDNYFNRPSYYRIDGKPVIYVYMTRGMKPDFDLTTFMSTIRTRARNKGIGEVYIVGDEVKGSPPSSNTRIKTMDAITSYDVYGHLQDFGHMSYATTSHVNSYQSYNQAWKTFANNAGVNFVPAILPGFNDSATRTGHNLTSRKLGGESAEFGSLFSALLEKAKLTVDSRNTIMVNSWNEWFEDSQIEPATGGAPTNVVDGIGTATTKGYFGDFVYYDSHELRYLEILRDSASTIPTLPTAPTNPSATSMALGNMRCSWQDNSNNETGFKVYYDAGAGTPVTYRATTDANATYYDVTGLSNNSQYSFQVLATNLGGDSSKTSNLSRYTLAGPPSVGNNILCDKSVNQSYRIGTSFIFSSPVGFKAAGPYNVSYFKYIWDTSPTHTWSGNEGSTWSTSPTVTRTPSIAGDYYLHVRSYNESMSPTPTPLDYGPFRVDGTAPTTSAQPVGGVYDGEVSVSLTAGEPADIYYTTDGSDPTSGSGKYSSPILVTGDTTLRFYAVDTAGNAESPKKTQRYWLLSGSGSIAAAKDLDVDDPVRLGGKHLHRNCGSFGYIQEPDRWAGVRVQGSALPAEGSVVSLVGTLQKPVGSECYVLLDAVTPSGPAAIHPLGMNGAALVSELATGLCVKTWGMVKAGSVTSNSFVLDDGSGGDGIRISTAGTPGVTEGFVVVTGAAGFDGSRVIYAMTVLPY